MHTLRFRQIHLDFHTSPAIPGIGADFDKQKWQETLKRAHVDSITLFAKCHHGWSYHPTAVGQTHPHLDFDLLRRQHEACKEIDINTPIYISAGVDNVAALAHPEWREINHEGRYSGWTSDVLRAGFHSMCFHSPYMDFLCEQIEEVVGLFPDCDGVFLDIISQSASCSRWGMEYMHDNGLDPEDPQDRDRANQAALKRYYERSTAACRVNNPEMPVFHNSGHVTRGKRDILPYFSHLELESLPTGGWGYDHFPVSAKYAKGLDMDFLGMTGKFHTTWGEFGGYKHPNALRYECAAMLAFGSKCSIGDQLPPRGALDDSTYEIIGRAYAEVEAKEAFCAGAEPVADVGLLSSSACQYARDGSHARHDDADDGAARILLEGHFLFDVLDPEMDFAGYRLLVLPDNVVITEALRQKINAYLAGGGKLMLTGTSGLDAGGECVFDIGASHHGQSELSPDFVLPAEDLRAEAVNGPVVMYHPSQRIKAGEGQSLGQVYDPYFNRTYRHFCSHQHTPYKPEPSGYDMGVINGSILYLAHPVFSLYCDYGAVPYQEIIVKTIRRFMGADNRIAVEGLPSTGRVSLMRQAAEGRYVLHLLHANTVKRGGGSGRPQGVEVIQEILPVRGVAVELEAPEKIGRVTLEPEGKEIPFSEKDGRLRIEIDEFVCHQMVVLHT